MRKEGRGFFITLLLTSAILFIALFVVFSKGFTLFTFKKFVVNKAFVSLLPKDYTLEQAEAVRGRVYRFYDTADERGLSDTAVFGISRKIQEMMSDEAITHEEIESLFSAMESVEKP
jgi:hypothetical protein